MTGHVNYDGANHEQMVRLRDERVRNIAQELPEAEPDGPQSGKLLVLGWGSTLGAIRSAMRTARQRGLDVAHLHLRHLNPFPKNLGEVLTRYERVLVPELNMGQLAFILRGHYLLDVRSLTKVQGKPFKSSEILEAIERETGS